MSDINTTTCRFYENKYPEVDDVVVVNVKEIADMGAYVKLLEYDDVEGMILLSELSRRRIRSIQKLIKVGRNEVAVVMRVDKDKGYIDLSKRRVSPEEATKAEERFNKSKAVHSILRHVAEKHKVPLETLYETIGWPLSRKYGHAYEGFKVAITNSDSVFEDIKAPSEDILEDLKAQIARKLTPNPIKVRADVEVTYFGYEGVDAVKNALRAGENLSTDMNPVKVKLVAAPLFVLTCVSLDKNGAVEALKKSIEEMKQSIESVGGTLNVKMEPKAVTASDDAELNKLMESTLAEQTYVSGDEDEDEDGRDIE